MKNWKEMRILVQKSAPAASFSVCRASYKRSDSINESLPFLYS